MASYTLHIQYVDRPAETRTISQPKVMIGRDAGDIVLHDSQVSGRHAEISWDGTTLRFTDLGSTNGSFLLQGQRVANLELTPGIALRLGNSLITVQAIEGASAAGKGRTVIAGPGMVPGFPAPMKNPPPARPPGPPAPGGNLAFAPTAQMQPPGGLRPPAPQPGGFAGPPAPQPGGFAGPPAPQPGGFAGPPAPQPGGFAGPPAPQPFGAGPVAPQPGGFAGPPAPQPFGAGPVAPPAPQPFTPQPVAAPQTAPNPAAAAAGPTPFPAPQPPGPPPGTLSGAQPQAIAPQPMGPQPGTLAPAPIAQPAVPAPAAAPPPGGGDVLNSADLGGAIKQIYAGGWSVLAPVVVTAVAVVAAVLVPIGVLAQLMLKILPLGIAGLLTMLLALAQFAALIVLYPALARFVLGNYLGQPIPIQAAVQEQIARVADVLVNCVIPGVVLGIFAGPIYFVEGKKIGEVISRNFALLGKELVPILVAIFAGAVAVGIGAAIVGYILLLLPFGWLLNSIFVNTLTSIMVAYGVALSVWLYFTVRRKHEGGDPEAEARARLGAAGTALPAA